jgi:uncharacterized protein YukJ
MPLKRYGVLKGRPIQSKAELRDDPHYQVRVMSAGEDYRLAINVKSREFPSELEYFVDDDFQHAITDGLLALPEGFTLLEKRPHALALDFIRGNLFSADQTRPLPFQKADSTNDLNDLLGMHMQRAISEQDARVYAFGERWGPEKEEKDKIFGFLPGNGIHDIHMNQGNSQAFARDDGVWQDGALLLHFPSANRWVGIFLKFQSQTWHTDDQTGHRIDLEDVTSDFIVRVVAALVNPTGSDSERETVMLINTSPQAIDLAGWAIADKLKNKQVLSGIIEPGSSLNVTLQQSVQLGNKGGIITLLNAQGLKVHGVSYTKEQARRQGWTVVF